MLVGKDGGGEGRRMGDQMGRGERESEIGRDGRKWSGYSFRQEQTRGWGCSTGKGWRRVNGDDALVMMSSRADVGRSWTRSWMMAVWDLGLRITQSFSHFLYSRVEERERAANREAMSFGTWGLVVVSCTKYTAETCMARVRYEHSSDASEYYFLFYFSGPGTSSWLGRALGRRELYNGHIERWS